MPKKRSSQSTSSNGSGSGRREECFLCGRPSTKRCEKCKLVYYCSKEHYRCHRQRDYCFPFKVIWKANTKCVVATRDIQPLELILFEWNLLTGPTGREFKNGGGRRDVCIVCFRIIQPNAQVKECGMCSMPICSDQCQVTNTHAGTECQILRRLSDDPDFGGGDSLDWRVSAVILIRLMILKQRSAFNSKEQKSDEFSRWQFLVDVSKTNSASAAFNYDSDCDPGWERSKRKLVRLLYKTGLVGEEDDDFLRRSLDLVRRNGISLRTHPHAMALFPIFSLFNHACVPSAKFQVYPDSNLAVQAQTKISKGQEISVCLVQTLEPTWKRQARLMRDFMLACNCKRCEDPTELGSNLSALKCGKCEPGRGRILPLNPLDPNSGWSCHDVHKNSTSLSARSTQQLQLDLQRDMYKNGLEISSMHQLESQIAMLTEFLHPHHGLLLAAKRSLIQCFSQIPASSVDRKHLELVKNLCLQQLYISDQIDPGFPDWKGNILKHLSATELNLARMDMEENRIPRPEFLLRVRKAMLLVQEGVRCRSTVKIDRSASTKMSQLVDELSEQSEVEDSSSCFSMSDTDTAGWTSDSNSFR